MKTLSSLIGLVFFCTVLKGQEAVFPPLPDSCFDVIIFNLPTVQTAPAKEHFSRQLDSLLASPNPDTLTLALVYRRLAVTVHLMYTASGGRGPQICDYALKSLQLLEHLSPRRESESAKSRLVYGYGLSTIGRYDTLIAMIETAVQRNKVLFGEFSQIQALHYLILGMAYNNVTRYKEAFFNIDQAVKIERQLGPGSKLQLAKCLFGRGATILNLGNLEGAMQDLLEAANLASPILGKAHPALGKIYERIGMVCVELGDFERAQEYHTQAVIIKDQSLGPLHLEALISHDYMASLYLVTGDFTRAVFHREKAWNGYKLNGVSNAVDRMYRMIELYAKVGDYKKEAEIFQNFPELPLGYVSMGYEYHALALIQQNRAAEALLWLDKASEINQLTNPGNIRVNHGVLLLKAEALTQLQRFDEALALLENVLHTSPLLDKKKQAQAAFANIHLKKFNLQRNKQELQKAWQYHLLALQTLDSMRYTYQSSASRIQQSELNFHLFEAAMNSSYEQRDQASSFWVAEKSKASALLENHRDDLARHIVGLPDSLLYREKSLKSQIAELEKTIYEKPAGADKKADEASLFEKKQNLNALLQSFEKNYPLYFKLKYNTSLASVAQLQANLPPATAMLEYFVGDSSIFIFSITPTDLQLQRIPKPMNFESNIQSLRQALTNAELRFLKKDLPVFSSAAGKLYDWLLAVPLAALPTGIKHLVIVPDGALCYLPFEILGKSAAQSDFKTYPYLLKNYSISYAASANLLLEQSKQAAIKLPGQASHTSLDLFAGFAPSYNSSDTLSAINSRTRSLLVRDENYEIPGAALEVQEIAKLLGGKTWLGEAATKTQFKLQSPNFRILHLAMHSIMDDANPLFSRLLFTQLKNTTDNNDLYANDLYNLRLPAQLVVLSACNTGNGQLRRGEGVMSLSRAFTFTGVPATVMSLWKAPDEATRQLMLGFYQNLKMGLRKDEALQQAKLAQLRGVEPGLSNPFFWAGFVANGEMGALLEK